MVELKVYRECVHVRMPPDRLRLLVSDRSLSGVFARRVVPLALTISTYTAVEEAQYLMLFLNQVSFTRLVTASSGAV